MRIDIAKTPQELGARMGEHAARLLREAIAREGTARLMLSTGASQFEMFQALRAQDVDWTRVEVFHLDEYIGIDETHPASFVGYLKQRFADALPLAAVHFIDGMAAPEATIAALTAEIRKRPIDVALIGIGENAHIAFNDPPADFDTRAAYHVVTLDERCKGQQVGEGWFATIDDVPRQAISATPYEILRARVILSAVPHAVKAQAVARTLGEPVSANTPATILKRHGDWTLYLDEASAADVVRM